MTSRLIECVPNFSEGRDQAVIDAIADAIRSVDGVSLLNVDPGKATNRTVYTFVGEPEPVCEAAFRAAAKGVELIDMSRHHGEHPRFGAMDVCPLVPISGVSMEEAVEYARALGRRLGEELGLTIFLYENAATREERRNLASVRAGEYEGLPEKLAQADWGPDFGPSIFNARSGAAAVGARDFLIAYNVNLNTTSVRRANSIAFDVREKGRAKRIGDPITGEIVRDSDGNAVYEPGSLASVKAIGWFIEEYGIAQISMNLTNFSVTPLHIAFDEVVEKAQARGIRVTGSELVGLVPLKALLDAGRYFLRKQRRSTGVSDAELIKIAVRTLGVNELSPFDRQTRVIEYAIAARDKKLVNLSVNEFVEETASESAAPGGGSISAVLGALGAALATMVANLSSHKRGWDDRWEEFSEWAEKGKAFHTELTGLIDSDTDAFNGLMAAFGLPKGSDEEKSARHKAIQDATREAIEVPLRVMRASHRSMAVIYAMAQTGNPNSVSDAGVGALCARSAVMGAFLNVQINASGLEDKSFVGAALQEGRILQESSQAMETEILRLVEAKILSAG
ncbi:MAG: glutamate formimidoyltransferase [Fimbriimonas sp.]